MTRSIRILVLAVPVALGGVVVGSGVLASDEPPSGVVQILPRGGIPAVFKPRFVAAGEAEIDAEAWILGVEMDGEARAYSLNLLNAHEVVNDRIGGAPIAAVW